MEVHEYNPERRFVMLNDPPPASIDDAQTKQTTTRPQKNNGTDNGTRSEAYPSRRYEPLENIEQPRADSSRPGLERRRSRQRLPPLHTDSPPRRPPEHHTCRSTAAADADRPSYFSPRVSRPTGDQLLSPHVIQSASGSRDKACRSSNFDERSPTRQPHFEVGDRNQGSLHHRRTRTSSTFRPIDVNFEAAKASKRLSGEWVSESCRPKDQSPSSRSVGKEDPRTSRRRQGEAGITPPRSPREQSRSSNASWDTHAYSGSQKPPIVVQDGHQASADTGERVRSRSRMRTMPFPRPDQAAAAGAAAAAFMPRSSATFPVVNGTQRQSKGTQVPPPYPDDDDPNFAGLGIDVRDVGSTRAAARPPLVVTMPEPAHVTSASTERSDEKRKPTSPSVTPKKNPDFWQPPPFDPERSRLSTDRPVGSYRRYSETKEQNGSGGLPECPRTVPVVGKVDWLTLPRTNFNICPTCYQTVFAKTEFRTHFQPILRPTDEAIACNFGSSPWYRIAWLLTVKHERQDLRLLHHVVSVAASPRSEACPGSRGSTRSWLTVNDPYTRRPVSGFAVCYQCAMTVEALLPNLAGLFVPLGSRSEPLKEVCALHFTPKRRRFVRYFDALETTSDKALVGNQAPDVTDLAQELRRLGVGYECREDSPVRDGYWHTMQSLPEMTVCDACFNEVVRPRVQDGNSVAQCFFTKAQRLPFATCQLYSPRMREIFQKACRRRDREYLEERVLERREIEADIYEKLLKLDKAQKKDTWSEKQVERLVEEWKRWE